MSKRAEARGDSLVEVLREVLRKIADVDDDAIDLDLGIDGVDLGDLSDIRLTATYSAAAKDAEDDRDDEDEDADESAQDQGDDDGDEDDDRDADDDGDDEDDGDDDEDDDEDAGQGITLDELDEEADAAADFLEGLLDAMGLPGDIQIRVHEDHAEVEIVDVGSGQLIGRRGQTLDSVQELLRCAIQRQFERRCRIVIDVEGYRQRRLEKLLDKAESAIDEVLATGEEQRLEPMDVHERKAVHRLVAEYDGVTSASRGREPTRRVVISTD